MCHLHSLHLLFYIINNYNKAIVLFNNFCAIQHLPYSYKGLCRLGWMFIMELCVLEVKERKKKNCEIEKLVRGWFQQDGEILFSHCWEVFRISFCYANFSVKRLNEKSKIIYLCCEGKQDVNWLISIINIIVEIQPTSYSIKIIVWSVGKEQCNTPDSPEGARVVAPRSPMSPHHIHAINTMIPAPNRSSSVNRHSSTSPTANGTPPPTVTPSSVSALLSSSASAHDSQRLLKIRRFLGALVQFGQDTNADVGDRLRSLVLSLAVSLFAKTKRELKLTKLQLNRAEDSQSRSFRLPYKKRQTFHFDPTCYPFSVHICHFCRGKSTA